MRSGVVRVFPHDVGPWLVRAGTVVFGVPPEIGKQLQHIDGIRPTPATLRKLLATADSGPVATGDGAVLAERLVVGLQEQTFSWRRFLRSRFPVWVRLPLMPASAVRRLARRCAPLARPRGLVLLGVLGSAGLFLPGPALGGFREPAALAVGVALLVASALWHELGHAAALQVAGYDPGGLGLGMLVVLPVLFVDVTPVALLSRRQRLLVNASGPVFQLALAAVFRIMALGSFLPLSVRFGLQLAAVSATMAVTWSLWPFIRSDGYWLACDALGIPGLDRPVPASTSRKARLLAAVLRVANAGFLLLVGVGFTLALSRRWEMGIWPPRLWFPIAAALALWSALTARILYLLRLMIRDLRAKESQVRIALRHTPDTL